MGRVAGGPLRGCVAKNALRRAKVFRPRVQAATPNRPNSKGISLTNSFIFVVVATEDVEIALALFLATSVFDIALSF
jgi:hypothetical protein